MYVCVYVCACVHIYMYINETTTTLLQQQSLFFSEK